MVNNIASFLIDHLNRFSEFKGRDLKCHSPSVGIYRRMLKVYDSIVSGANGDLSVAQIIDILRSNIHPDYH